jgi:hypothetical protein
VADGVLVSLCILVPLNFWRFELALSNPHVEFCIVVMLNQLVKTSTVFLRWILDLLLLMETRSVLHRPFAIHCIL